MSVTKYKCVLLHYLTIYWIKDRVNVHWRDPQTALDTTSSIESVHEFLKNHPRVSNLALVQCTSPFISRSYLQKAIKKFSKRHCVFSAVRSFKLRWRKDVKTKKIMPVNFNYTKRPRRQDWKGKKDVTSNRSLRWSIFRRTRRSWDALYQREKFAWQEPVTRWQVND